MEDIWRFLPLVYVLLGAGDTSRLFMRGILASMCLLRLQLSMAGESESLKVSLVPACFQTYPLSLSLTYLSMSLTSSSKMLKLLLESKTSFRGVKWNLTLTSVTFIAICNLNFAKKKKKYAGIVYYLWVPEETVLILYNTYTIISSQSLYNIRYYTTVLLSIIYLLLYNICYCTMVLLWSCAMYGFN